MLDFRNILRFQSLATKHNLRFVKINGATSVLHRDLQPIASLAAADHDGGVVAADPARPFGAIANGLGRIQGWAQALGKGGDDRIPVEVGRADLPFDAKYRTVASEYLAEGRW